MFHNKLSIRNGALSAMSLLTLAGSAIAQDGALSMSLDRNRIDAGESVQVEVAGRFPASAYALAEAEFRVWASTPTWLSASSGILGGHAVWDAHFEQAHLPMTGIFADPTNPMPIWQGEYQPDVAGPAFIRLQAQADHFAYYPSDLTSSTVETDALPGRQYLWVDPVAIPGVGEVAPGEGTGMDVRLDGSIVAEPGDDSAILIGLLLPAVQKVREASVRMDTDAQPTRATTTLQLDTGSAGASLPVEQLSFNFTRIDGPSPADTMYELTSEAGFSHGVLVCLIGPDGELICGPSSLTAGGAQSAPIIRFDRLPGCLTFTIEQDDVTGEDVVALSPCDDEPFFVEIPGVYKGLTTGPIEVRTDPRWFLVDGIEGESVEMHGLPAGREGQVAFEFSATFECDADFDGDGALTIFDFLAFQNAFDRGLRSADFDGDGEINLFDFLAFQNAFDRGCL